MWNQFSPVNTNIKQNIPLREYAIRGNSRIRVNSVKNSKTVFSHRSCSNVNVIRVCVNACTREIRSSRYNPLNAFDVLKYPDSYCFLVEKNHEKKWKRKNFGESTVCKCWRECTRREIGRTTEKSGAQRELQCSESLKAGAEYGYEMKCQCLKTFFKNVLRIFIDHCQIIFFFFILSSLYFKSIWTCHGRQWFIVV